MDCTSEKLLLEALEEMSARRNAISSPCGMKNNIRSPDFHPEEPFRESGWLNNFKENRAHTKAEPLKTRVFKGSASYRHMLKVKHRDL
jgi:hypothetical protein